MHVVQIESYLYPFSVFLWHFITVTIITEYIDIFQINLMMSSERPHNVVTISEDISCWKNRVKNDHTWSLLTFHVPEKNTESLKATSRTTEELGKVIEGLRWLAAAFGLFPWGVASANNLCNCFMKIACNAIIPLVASISYPVFESECHSNLGRNGHYCQYHHSYCCSKLYSISCD